MAQIPAGGVRRSEATLRHRRPGKKHQQSSCQSLVHPGSSEKPPDCAFMAGDTTQLTLEWKYLFQAVLFHILWSLPGLLEGSCQAVGWAGMGSEVALLAHQRWGAMDRGQTSWNNLGKGAGTRLLPCSVFKNTQA